MQTAGRTVLFSAGTVMVSLSALAIFDVPYLRSFAFAGVAVVALGGVRRGRDPAGGARDPRAARREGPDLQAQARVRERRLLGRAGPAGDEAPGAVRGRRQRGAAPARDPVPLAQPRPHRRPRRAADASAAATRSTRSARTSRPAKPTPSRCRCPTSDSRATPTQLKRFGMKLAKLPGRGARRHRHRLLPPPGRQDRLRAHRVRARRRPARFVNATRRRRHVPQRHAGRRADVAGRRPPRARHPRHPDAARVPRVGPRRAPHRHEGVGALPSSRSRSASSRSPRSSCCS